MCNLTAHSGDAYSDRLDVRKDWSALPNSAKDCAWACALSECGTKKQTEVCMSQQHFILCYSAENIHVLKSPVTSDRHSVARVIDLSRKTEAQTTA